MFQYLASIVLLLAVAADASNHGETKKEDLIYTVSMPKVIRPDMELIATASIVRYSNPVTVYLFFFSLDQSVDYRVSTTISSGETKKVTIGKMPIDYLGNTTFNLTIIAYDADTSKEVVAYDSTNDFQYIPKPFSIIIQTDRDIYRPGETCYFRALCMTPELKPLQGNISIAVKDPKLNKGFWVSNQNLTVGLAGGSYNFSRQASEGEWTILVTYKGYTEKIKVAVHNYRRPSFDVEVQAPKAIDWTTEALTIKLKANHSNAQLVKGKSVLTIEMMPLTTRSFPPKIITFHNMKFNGEISYTITKAQIRSQLGWNGESDMKIEVIGIVTDGISKQINNDSKKIDAKRSHINVKILSAPNVIKPGLTYQALVIVGTADEKPLTSADTQANKMTVEVTYHSSQAPHPLDLDLSGFNFPGLPSGPHRPSSIVESHTFDIPPHGVVPVSFGVKKDNFEHASMKFYVNATKSLVIPENEITVSRARSPSSSFIQLIPIKDTLYGDIKVGKSIDMKVQMTESVHKLNIMVLSRGQILVESQKVLNQTEMEQKETSFSFKASLKMTPSCVVLASYIGRDKEVVADYLNVNVDPDIRRKVVIKNITVNGTEVSEVKPGTNVTINVETKRPDSYVGLLAVDHNTIVLKPKYNVSNERVIDDLEKYIDTEDKLLSYLLRFSYARGALDAQEVYKKAGINIITNSLVYKCPHCSFDNEVRQKKPVEASEFQTDMMKRTSPTPRIRALFPKTWLFEEAKADKDGVASFKGTTLKTMRDWEISAFSLSEADGLQVSPPRRLKVFKKFFVNLEMPLKVTKNEIMIAQAHIFNYHEQELRVQVSLEMNQQMLALLAPGGRFAINPIRYVTIPAGGRVIVKYPLCMSTLGDIPIKISASALVLPVIKDEIVKNVFVEPEGIEQCYTTSTLIDRYSDTTRDVEYLNVRFPQTTIPGSQRVSLHVYGDLLADVMHSLGKLIRMPNGTGEPTLLTFTPGLLVSKYLTSTEELEPKFKEQIVKQYLEAYQVLLRYKKDDGSFNFFGKPEEPGSTWLTALACKSLLLAEQFDHRLVENRIIEEALKFLIERQKPDGSFTEMGDIVHKDMQAGPYSTMTITAQVLITFMKVPTEQRSQALLSALNRAKLYLETNYVNIQLDPYPLSMVAYALTLCESSSALVARQTLTRFAVAKNKSMYWYKLTPGVSWYSEEYLPGYFPVKTPNVEVSSYALLAFAHVSDVAKTTPITRWLVSKQNELEGYGSSHDTVLAIEALTTSAHLLRRRQQNLALKIEHTRDDSFISKLNITEENYLDYNTIPVTGIEGELKLTMERSGLGVVHMIVCYNIPTSPYETVPFNCTTTKTSANKDEVLLKHCCSLREGQSSTGMFLMELELLSGFTVDLEDIRKLNTLSKLVELDENKLNFYYEQLHPRESFCAKARLMRNGDVAANKPATIIASEYYKPEKNVISLYEVDELSQTGVCDVCGSDCVGCPAPVLSEWKPFSPCVEFCLPEVSVSVQECYDSSLKRAVDITKCGLTEQPMRKRNCSKHFTCPTVSDGLWYDLPSHIPHSKVERPCSIQSQKKTIKNQTRNVPGVLLNGVSDYLQCSDPKLVVITPEVGFTISMLVHPTGHKRFGPTTYLSIGKDGEVPIVLFEKPSWTDETRLDIKIGIKKYLVKGITTEHLPLGKWSQVIITWSEEAGAKVYINGVEVGVSEISTLPVYQHYHENMKFYLGKNSYAQGHPWQQGFLSGKIAALNYWPAVLPLPEIEALAEFYEGMVEFNEEPILSVRHLRHFAPLDRKVCFNKPSLLSMVYTGVNGKCPLPLPSPPHLGW